MERLKNPVVVTVTSVGREGRGVTVAQTKDELVTAIETASGFTDVVVTVSLVHEVHFPSGPTINLGKVG